MRLGAFWSFRGGDIFFIRQDICGKRNRKERKEEEGKRGERRKKRKRWKMVVFDPNRVPIVSIVG